MYIESERKSVPRGVAIRRKKRNKIPICPIDWKRNAASSDNSIEITLDPSNGGIGMRFNNAKNRLMNMISVMSEIGSTV